MLPKVSQPAQYISAVSTREGDWPLTVALGPTDYSSTRRALHAILNKFCVGQSKGAQKAAAWLVKHVSNLLAGAPASVSACKRQQQLLGSPTEYAVVYAFNASEHTQAESWTVLASVQVA